jgi:hypothetical protein
MTFIIAGCLSQRTLRGSSYFVGGRCSESEEAGEEKEEVGEETGEEVEVG